MIQLRMYLQALRRNWWVVVVVAAVAAAAAGLISSLAPPVYQTRLQLLVVPNMTEFGGRDLIYSLDTLDNRSVVATYVEVANSSRIRREALAEVAIAVDDVPAYQLTAVALPEANVIEVAASGPDGETAVSLANAAAASTIAYVGQTYDIYRLEQLDPAPLPLTPVSPTPWRDAGLALLLGLALGGVLAILRGQVQEPLIDSLRQWQAHDHASSAYKRAYLDYQLTQLLPAEAPNLLMAVVRLEGLAQLALPAPVAHGLMRRVVQRIRDELAGRDFVGRWDDHSFAVVMRRVDSTEEAYQKLARLQHELSQQPIEVYPGGEVVQLAPRLAAVMGREGDTLASLHERLVIAMNYAETNGLEPTLYRQEMRGRQQEGVAP
ncbi:MAG: diguanylate cyclase [Anaerolineales bacterium]|nr:diguanylate cyclase [Anaerolineales bacterium]